MIVEKLRQYFINCPLIDEFAPIHVDKLYPENKNFNITPVPNERIVNKYFIGAKCQYLFTLSSLESTEDDRERIANSDWYERFIRWVDEQNKKRNFPTEETIKLEAITDGYLFAEDESQNGQYQVQMKLIYYDEEM